MITGFRGARFAVDATEVQRVITRDFAMAPAAITAINYPAEKTKILAVSFEVFEPGPGSVKWDSLNITDTQLSLHSVFQSLRGSIH